MGVQGAPNQLAFNFDSAKIGAAWNVTNQVSGMASFARVIPASRRAVAFFATVADVVVVAETPMHAAECGYH